MFAKSRSTAGALLRGLARILFVLGVIAFIIGGQTISEFGGTDRLPAEMAGIELALLCGLIGVIAKIAGERLSEE